MYGLFRVRRTFIFTMDNNEPNKRKKHSRTKCIDKLFKFINESPNKSKKIDHPFSHDNGNRRLTRGMLQKLDKQNTLQSLSSVSRKRSLRNSVIIVNDNDNETSEKDTEDASRSIIECSPTILKRKSSKEELWKTPRRCKHKSSNVSIVQSSSAQSPGNGENIAPSQTEDDVIVLWSSLTNSKPKKRERIVRYCDNKPTRKVKFVIDTKPNPKYLECLKTDMEPARKKRKLCHKHDKLTLSSDKNWERKHNANDADLNLSHTRSNAQSCQERLHEHVSCRHNGSHSNRKLREIIVDGCNVAMAHTNGRWFSVKGIKLVVDYFTIRGHVVKVFLPNHLRKHMLLEELYKEGVVVFTPSRNIEGRQITSYDDRYILEYATACGGIVISLDQYRDLYHEKPEWRDTILNRLLMPTFVGDYIMFPEDPLGKSGPNLKTFLQHR